MQAKGDLDQWYNFIYGGNEGIMRTLNQSMMGWTAAPTASM